MKPKKLSKKLVLNKSTIADLKGVEMKELKGGGLSFLTICGDSCKPGCSDIYPCDTVATCVPTYCDTCTTFCTCLSGCEC